MEKSKQDKLRKFVNNEVIINQSMLVDDLLGSEFFSYDDLINFKEDTEVYEWYICTYWLIKKLEEKGEVILRTDYGDYWGRQCTGQAVFLDGIIEEIAKEVKVI